MSRVLLDRIGSKARLLSAHQHNERAVCARVIGLLTAGEDVALITDAGTPAISDPGSQIVAAAHAAGIPVVPIPGPSAPVTLLSAAGLPPGPFLFEGFLPPKDKARRSRLQQLRDHADVLGAHVVLFEAPHRIVRTLAAIAGTYGGRRELVIGRELTKKFEQIVRCPIADAGPWLLSSSDHQRGEFVLIIGAVSRSADADDDRSWDGGTGLQHPLDGRPGEAGSGEASSEEAGSGEGTSAEDSSGSGSSDEGMPGEGTSVGGTDGSHAPDDDAGIASPFGTAARRMVPPLRELLVRLLRDLPTSRAVKLAQELTGAPHREVYALALALKKADGQGQESEQSE